MKQKYKIFDISCGKCGQYLLTYHKYGAGKGILRLYFAHIVAPTKLLTLLKKDYAKINDVPNLTCPNCQEVIGVSALSKSKRWVYRMRQGYFHRKWKK